MKDSYIWQINNYIYDSFLDFERIKDNSKCYLVYIKVQFKRKSDKQR